MGIPNTILIAITELKGVAEAEPDYAKRVEKVMAAASQHWMVVDEAEQFKAACGALLLTSPGYEDEIKAQLKALNALGALMSGVPVDFEQLAEENRNAPKPSVHLRDAYKKARDARGY